MALRTRLTAKISFDKLKSGTDNRFRDQIQRRKNKKCPREPTLNAKSCCEKSKFSARKLSTTNKVAGRRPPKNIKGYFLDPVSSVFSIRLTIYCFNSFSVTSAGGRKYP